MKLSQAQERTLEKLRQERLKHNYGFLHANQPARSLLDIIDTLLTPEPTPHPAVEAQRGYEWVQDHPDGPNWYRRSDATSAGSE